MGNELNKFLNKNSKFQFIGLVALTLCSTSLKASGYYNLSTFLRSPPQLSTEQGAVGTIASSITCAPGAKPKGFTFQSGWIIDGVALLCNDSTTVGYIGSTGPYNSNSCSGAGNNVYSLAVRAFGYQNQISQFNMVCYDGTSYVWGGSGAGGWGTWQPVTKCPIGYSPIGLYSSNGTSSMGLVCGANNFEVYNTVLVAEGPTLGYWRLGESSGTTAVDASGSNNTGTYRGTVTFGGTGAIRRNSDTSVTFNGTTGFLSTTTQTVHSGAHSVELWFKTSTSTGGGLAGHENLQTATTGVTGFTSELYMNANGSLTFYIWNGTGQSITSAAGYNNNVWHHVVASLGSAGMQLWIDGYLVASNGVTSMTSITGYWRLGHNKQAGFFNGQIDEAAIYSRQLSEYQIVRHFANSNQTIYTSCNAIKNAGEAGNNGIYIIDPDDTYGPLDWMPVYCDMTYNGGGWTLIGSTDGSTANYPVSSTLLSTTAGGILSSSVVIPLANWATSVRVTTGALSAGTFTSSSSAGTMAKLRAYQILNDSNMYASNPNTAWTGTNSVMWYSCAPGGGYTSSLSSVVYHACFNGAGLHWIASGPAGWNNNYTNLNLWVK